MRDAHEMQEPKFVILCVWSMTELGDGSKRFMWAANVISDIPTEEQFEALQARGLNAYIMRMTREEYRWLTTHAEVAE